VCDKKKLSFFFVSDIISGIGSGLFGQGYCALGPNHKMKVFC